MTVGGDFIPYGDGTENQEPNYSVVFGIKLTPTISGTLLALAGLAGAAYLLLNVVQPAWQRNQELQADIATKEQQLVDQGEAQRQIEDARARLQEAERLRADVLALFASDESLDTLLLDLNERVQSANARISDPDRQAKLLKFELSPETGENPDGTLGQVVSNGEFGAAVNGKLIQRIYNVEMEGNFAQTLSIIRNIERLQPLLVVRDFKSEISGTLPPVRVEVQPGGVRVLGDSQQFAQAAQFSREPRLRTSFELIALQPAPLVPIAPAAPADPAAVPAP